MSLGPLRRLFVIFCGLLLYCPALVAAEGATVTYRKVFKSSSPEFVEIQVGENGASTYDIRQLEEEADPRSFQVSRLLATKIFELAAQLNYFRGLQLDVRRRIANLGEKTFRYTRGGEVHEVSFNYTLNREANELLQIFEGLARQQQHLDTLLRRMRYDRLGVNDALMRFESELNHKMIPEPERLLPALDQIANDPRVIEIARQRARALAGRIRATR